MVDKLAEEVSERLKLDIRVQRVRQREWTGWGPGRGYTGKLICTGRVKLIVRNPATQFDFMTGAMSNNSAKSLLAAILDLGNMGMLTWYPKQTP